MNRQEQIILHYTALHIFMGSVTTQFYTNPINVDVNTQQTE